jgi:3-oxoadipate enol-lactonase
MPIVRVRDLDLYHELHGAGPPLLSISGTGNDLRFSRPDLSPLNDRFTVAHYDQRGLGRTSVPPGPYTMADYADDAAGLLDVLGWERVPVVGVSFGGMVAQQLALRHPDRVQRLVLACTSSGGRGGSSVDLRALEELPEGERTTASLRLMDTRYDPDAGSAPPGLDTVIALLRSRDAAPPDPERARGARLQLDARARHDVYDRLPSVGVPTLVIGGRFDALAPPENSAAIAAAVPGARLELCDGGHLFMLQDPTAWPTILGFLEEGPAA